MSKAEQDRQQILEEMKKRTQLLTDNSWIRQRSSSFYKEPVYVGLPMKRWALSLSLNLIQVRFQVEFKFHLSGGFSAGTSLWTTWMLCVSRPSPPPRSVTLVHTQLQQVTSPRAGTPPPATALERFYPRETPPWTLLITAGRQHM